MYALLFSEAVFVGVGLDGLEDLRQDIDDALMLRHQSRAADQDHRLMSSPMGLTRATRPAELHHSNASVLPG